MESTTPERPYENRVNWRNTQSRLDARVSPGAQWTDTSNSFNHAPPADNPRCSNEEPSTYQPKQSASHPKQWCHHRPLCCLATHLMAAISVYVQPPRKKMVVVLVCSREEARTTKSVHKKGTVPSKQRTSDNRARVHLTHRDQPLRYKIYSFSGNACQYIFEPFPSQNRMRLHLRCRAA